MIHDARYWKRASLLANLGPRIDFGGGKQDSLHAASFYPRLFSFVACLWGGTITAAPDWLPTFCLLGALQFVFVTLEPLSWGDLVPGQYNHFSVNLLSPWTSFTSNWAALVLRTFYNPYHGHSLPPVWKSKWAKSSSQGQCLKGSAIGRRDTLMKNSWSWAKGASQIVVDRIR